MSTNIPSDFVIWTLTVPSAPKLLIKLKLTYTLVSTLFCGTSNRFYKGHKDLHQFFEVPQRSVKIKIYDSFYYLFRIGMVRIKDSFPDLLWNNFFWNYYSFIYLSVDLQELYQQQLYLILRCLQNLIVLP